MGVLDVPETPGVDWPQMAWDMIRLFEPERSRAAIQRFDELVGPLLEARRGAARRSNLGTDLISALVTAELDGDKLTDAGIFSFVRLMFPAGSDTTYLAGCRRSTTSPAARRVPTTGTGPRSPTARSWRSA
jgi:cytochrome P450